MMHEESEDMSFRVPQLEKNMEKNMVNMEKGIEKLEEGMDKIVNLIKA